MFFGVGKGWGRVGRGVRRGGGGVAEVWRGGCGEGRGRGRVGQGWGRGGGEMREQGKARQLAMPAVLRAVLAAGKAVRVSGEVVERGGVGKGGGREG